MKTKIIASISGLLLSFLSPIAILVPQVSAAADTCTWTGATDDLFNEAGNWTGCDGAGIPENGDSLEFDVSSLASNETIDNNIASLSVAGINVTGTSASYYSYTVEGNAITITGDITGDTGNGSLTLSVDVTLGANITYSATGSRVNFGKSTGTPNVLDLGAFDLEFDTPAVDCGTYIYMSLDGTGNISSTATADAMVFFAAASGYSGDITSNGDGVAIFKDAVYGFSTVTINGSGTLALVNGTADATFDINAVMNSDADAALMAGMNPFACAGGGSVVTKYATTLAGDLTLSRDTIFSGTNDLIVEGTYTSNSHDLTTKLGSQGSITTSEGTTETPAVTTTIDADDKTTAYLTITNKETVILLGGRGSVNVGTGGILKGTGTAEDIFVASGGTIAPGLSPGCITVTSGGLLLSGIYEVEIAGDTVCSEYDQTDVTGTVDVSGGTLNTSFLNGFVPALNDEFIIINNDASDAVTGEFTDLADGSSFVVDGVTFQINYDGGDGNDVVLTATAVPTTVTTPDTGIGQVLQNPFLTLVAVLLSIGALVGFKRIQTTK